MAILKIFQNETVVGVVSGTLFKLKGRSCTRHIVFAMKTSGTLSFLHIPSEQLVSSLSI